jgi:hypothetical protein
VTLVRHESVRRVRDGTVRPRPTWLDSVLFLALMSGPPSIRDRDMYASLAGVIDTAIAVRVGVWALGALWIVCDCIRHW